MKIVYLLDLPTSPQSGVGEKIKTQVELWSKNHHDILLIVVTPHRFTNDWIQAKLPAKVVILSYSSIFFRVFCRVKSSIYIWKLNRKEKIYIYWRLSIPTPDQILLILRNPYFLEVNSDVLTEYKIRRNKIIFLVYWALERSLTKKAQYVFFVTKELEDKYSVRYALQNTKFITNGIKLGIPNNCALNFQYDLVFLVTEILPWHGLDKFIKIAKDNVSLSLVLITKNPLSEESLRLISETKNITTLSMLSHESIKDVMDVSVAGLSQLSMETLGLKEAASLKTRTYLSHGLPVVTGSRDSAFSAESDFIYLLDDSNEKLLEFLSRWRFKRVSDRELDAINAENLESERLEIMEYVAKKFEKKSSV